jgi:hypothetical protein
MTRTDKEGALCLGWMLVSGLLSVLTDEVGQAIFAVGTVGVHGA